MIGPRAPARIRPSPPPPTMQRPLPDLARLPALTSLQATSAWLAALAAFLALDAVWLTTMGPRLYTPHLGPLLRPDPDLVAAALFYLLYLSGLVAFAVAPAVGAASWTGAAARGAAFGLVAYATYDLTNQATLRGWPWAVTAADLAWGMVVSAAGASAGWWGARAMRAARPSR